MLSFTVDITKKVANSIIIVTTKMFKNDIEHKVEFIVDLHDILTFKVDI
jgi:hypothetical protein